MNRVGHAPRTLVALVLTLASLATGTGAGHGSSLRVAPPPPWQSKLGREHPLAGRIWDVGTGRFIDAATLAARLAPARFVLLGERHDNPDHHQLQAWAVRALVVAGRRPAVGFEMLTMDQAPALARHLAASPRDAAGLGDAVGWKRSGWPDWATYQPIAEAALDAGLPIVATNLSAAMLQAMRQAGMNGLDPGFVTRARLDRPLPEDQAVAMAAEIRESHCGHAPESAIPKMIAIQRARDAHLAERLLAVATSDGAVLIAGAGHVSTDRGVPFYLRSQAPDASVVSVAFIEVEDGHGTPAEHAARTGGGTFPFDYVWFTPRTVDEDSCEAYRKSLERLRDRR